MVVFGIGIGYHLAEIAPDHYDFIIDEPFAAARNDAAQSRTADSLQGEFGLSFDASRAGLILRGAPMQSRCMARKRQSPHIGRKWKRFPGTHNAGANPHKRSRAERGPTALALEPAGQKT